jgi:hypothetical protein
MEQKEANRENLEEVRKLDQQEEVLSRQHYAKMREMDHKYALAWKSTFTQIIEPFKTGFTSLITSLVEGTGTLATSIKDMFSNLLNVVIGMLGSLIMNWMAAKVALLAINAAASLGIITNQAAVAAAKSYAAYADIPFIGIALGAAAAAALIGIIMGLKGMVRSSAGGWWQVPKEAVTVLHPEETVLPAWAAENIRNFFSDGPTMQAAGVTIHGGINIPIQTVERVTPGTMRRLTDTVVIPRIEDHLSRYGGRLKK